MKIAPALCLDLDGTIRYSRNGKFINKPADIALFPDVEAKLWEYRDIGWLILGLSNQGGVAYGILSPTDEAVGLKTTFDLFERNPFHIVKSCYHHPKGKLEPYCHESLLRKPHIGMLALCEFEVFNLGWVIDWPGSLMVGDRDEDHLCALRAEIKFLWAWEFFGRPQPDAVE